MARIDHPEPDARSAREAAVGIVAVLRRAGHVAYLAGGCVRDQLLGLSPKDYDVATDARPEKVRGLFRRSRSVGESFGVVQVHVQAGGPNADCVVEVATFRTEWGYQDGRRPSKVRYTDARSDAQRRDFTINALFEDPFAEKKDDRIIDFVGGQADLRAGLVRAVGDPESRLCEDYLRLLRAVRFAARLKFQIESHTADAIKLHAKDLGRISRHRIGQEAMWMLTPSSDDSTGATSTRIVQAIQWIQQLHLDGPMLEEDPSNCPLPTVTGLVRYHQTQSAVVGYPTILAAWLLDRHFSAIQLQPPHALTHTDPDPATEPLSTVVQRLVDHELGPIITRWRRALCLSNRHRTALRRTVELLPVALGWSGLRVAGQKRLLAAGHWPQVNALVHAMADHPDARASAKGIADQWQGLIAQGISPTPWVSGDDLIAMGRKPGPIFRRLLEAVYDAQLEGAVTSRDEAIQWLEQHP